MWVLHNHDTYNLIGQSYAIQTVAVCLAVSGFSEIRLFYVHRRYSLLCNHIVCVNDLFTIIGIIIGSDLSKVKGVF